MTQKYTLKDFCIEFKDAVNDNPEMESGLRQLIEFAHHEGFQLGWKDGHAEAVEEIIKIAEGMQVHERCNYMEPGVYAGYKTALTDLIEAIKK